MENYTKVDWCLVKYFEVYWHFNNYNEVYYFETFTEIQKFGHTLTFTWQTKI